MTGKSFRNAVKPGLVIGSVLVSCGSLGVSGAASLETSPTGMWRTIDDKTGKPRAIVRVYEQNGRWFGKIEKSLVHERLETCDKCTDERRNQPLLGMVVMRDMRKRGDEYSGGDILDPDTGWIYRCKFRLTDNGNKMSLRGYLGISLVGRTQVWIREQ